VNPHPHSKSIRSILSGPSPLCSLFGTGTLGFEISTKRDVCGKFEKAISKLQIAMPAGGAQSTIHHINRIH
jgi:hypothetical protein